MREFTKKSIVKWLKTEDNWIALYFPEGVSQAKEIECRYLAIEHDVKYRIHENVAVVFYRKHVQWDDIKDRVREALRVR